MAGEPYITVVGNLAGDPELRWTSSGHAVANFTIAQTPRNYDKTTQQYVDDETLWVRASVWRDVAENVAETLSKGIRVIAHGRLKARSFETKEGQQRTNWELDVDEIGPSLRWSTAQVNRTPKQGGQQSGNAGQFNQQAPPPAGNQQASAFGQMSQGQDVWGGGQQGQAPPF
ncbi:MAG: single-stranded DNA-binding protein [Yaniella sp.]|uniref:single-stranded DNA-binding protein n=1 Tax=Yaniella sp. TaxID=2773929 RepID=UPI00264A319D|nr:single-stranded DNA-binding protein [Yaniella sp.]MDN6758998.1 single-stranded DNA-binding protein [Yaniella sp.]